MRILLVVACLALGFLPLLAAQALGQVTAMTDKPCYTMGETVTISGMGWEPGETVQISIREESLGVSVLLSPLADGAGMFSTDQFVVPAGSEGASLRLDCQGQTSGSTAGVSFPVLAAFEPPPSVATDKANYSPGEVVVIRGSGWEPGEAISLTIHEDPAHHFDTVLVAEADPAGAFANADFVIQPDDVGARFTLDVQGLTSGKTARMLFTDGLLESPPPFVAKWGSWGSGEGHFINPLHVAVDSDENVYVYDWNNYRIQKFTSTGTFIRKWGDLGDADGFFSDPEAIAVDGENIVYVADTGHAKIQKFDADGQFVGTWGTRGDGDGQFRSPNGIAVGPDGLIYVCDRSTCRVQVFTSSGVFIRKWGANGSGDGQFQYPLGVAVDAGGNVYVADRVQHRIQKFTSDGVFVTKWGAYGGGEAQFCYPYDVETDATGNVYVSDQWNCRVQKFTSDGVFLTMWGSSGSGDGQFYYHSAGLAIGESGKIYIADAHPNNRIQVFGPPPTGGVGGFVTAICPSAGTGIAGVSIAVYKDGPGQTFVRGAVTDPSGHYRLGDVLAGTYWIRIVPPSHLSVAENDVLVSVSPGTDVAADFELLDTAAPQPTLEWLPDVLGECSATITEQPTAYDDCTGLLTGVTTDPLEYTTQGTFTVHWNYVDASGNQILQEQRVTVRDEMAPSIQAPPAVTMVAESGPAGCVALVSDEALGTAAASDNCAGAFTLTRSGVPEGNLFAVGTTTVTWTAMDGAGNSASATQEVRVTPAPGGLAGRVLADCPAAGTGLLGVRVDVFDDLGTHIGTTLTDGSGAYQIGGLASGEPLTVTVVTPLGYVASAEDMAAQIACGETVALDFALTCVEVVANPRSSGFWKHQVGVATGGPGSGQVDGLALCAHLDMIAAHFNSNEMNPVVVYEPPSSGTCEDKLQVAKALLNLRGNAGMTARARQQLMSLLFNVAAGYIGQQHVVSQDGATVSQAITYCDQLIDGPVSEHELAKTIADRINNNQIVEAGLIPLTTDDIAYKQPRGSEVYSLGQNLPNPFKGLTTITYALRQAGDVRVAVCDVSGRVVRVLAQGPMDAGQHRVEWDGTDASGTQLAGGVYFYRLEARAEGEMASRFRDQKKMMVLR